MPVETMRVGNVGKDFSLPEILLGQKPDTYLIFQTFWTTVAHVMLTASYQSFILKSKGKADQFGESWKPLAPSTIYGKVKVSNGSDRGMLTASQNKLWKGIYASNLERKMLTMSLEQAKKESAQLAWGILKKRGAILKRHIIGSYNPLIMVVTGRLRDSLKPNPLTIPYSPKTDQLFEVTNNRIRFGSLVPYAGKMDQTRPVIPDGILQYLDYAIQQGYKAIAPLVKQYGRTT